MSEYLLGNGVFEISNCPPDVLEWRRTGPEATAVLLHEERRGPEATAEGFRPRVFVPLRTDGIASDVPGELIARVTDNSRVPDRLKGLGPGEEARIAAGFLRPERRRVYQEQADLADTVLIWDEQHLTGFFLHGFGPYLNCRIDLVWRTT